MSESKQKRWLFVGGYGTSIETFGFDPATGALTAAALTEGVPEAPTFLALDAERGVLFAVSEKGGPDSPEPGRAVSFTIDAHSGKLTRQTEVWAGGSNAVFVALSRDGKHLLTTSSSTAEGRVAVIPVASDGKLSEPSDSQIAGKNAHGLAQSPDGAFVWVVCRGDELIAQYRFDQASGKLSALDGAPAVLPVPSGPRHIAAHPTLRKVYVLLDWSGEIACYSYGADGALTLSDKLSAFPEGKRPTAAKGKMTAAEIEVSRDGRRVYASTRTPECQSLAVLDVDAAGRLKLVANEEAGGLICGPRHFVLSPDNAHLFLANQDSDSVLAFSVDASTGRPRLLGNAPTPTRVKQPNALAFGTFG